MKARIFACVLAVVLLGACAAEEPAQPTATETAAPARASCGEATIEQTEGPYFKAGSPQRDDITAGRPGDKLVVTGKVLDLDCEPVEGAVVDFWQADGEGNYDNAGFDLRGHQETDADGRYTVTTVLPGLYEGRTRHIHVKVQAPGRPVLTTQLYIPGEEQNSSDGIFEDSLLVDLSDDGKTATYDFVVETS